MKHKIPDVILAGTKEKIEKAIEMHESIPVDLKLYDKSESYNRYETTLKEGFEITGPGTFSKNSYRKLYFEPSNKRGFWFYRKDLKDSMPIPATIYTVWNTGKIVSNIVLCSGSPHNYVRMVEHLIAVKLGMRLDNVKVILESGDPPLLEDSCQSIAKKIKEIGLTETSSTVRYITVKEPVCIYEDTNRLLIIEPAEEKKDLIIDCSIDFPNAIGKQRIIINVTPETFLYGSVARTNTSFTTVLYTKTIGKLFADIRNLGYNRKNILVAMKTKYFNTPRLIHNNKSLEAVWHRTILDLTGAFSIISEGRFVGKIISYRSGHRQDIALIRQLYLKDLLQEI